jgi:hypothetical protein
MSATNSMPVHAGPTKGRKMKQLIVSCNVTVDGFMAGPDSDLASLDFIVDDRQLEDDLTGKFRSVADTIVVGRQTFFDMEAYWTTVDSDMAAWLNTTPKIVLSQTATSTSVSGRTRPWPQATAWTRFAA